MAEILTVLSLTPKAAELCTKLYGLYDKFKNREMQQELDDIITNVRDLKRQAELIEDENRDLKLKLRFKSEDYKFDGAFWYHQDHPERPLCPKCHVDCKDAPMSQPGGGEGSTPYRKCLHCGAVVEIPGAARIPIRHHFDPPGEWS